MQTVEFVTKYFGYKKHRMQTPAGTDLNAYDGEIIPPTGPSRGGKSAFPRLAACLKTPCGGRMLFDGKPTSGTYPKGIPMFREDGLFPWPNVRDGAGFGLRMTGIPAEGRAKSSDKSNKYPETVHLKKFVHSYRHQSSVDMKQSTAAARALATERRMLPMGELFEAPDTYTRDHRLCEVQDTWRENGETILAATHNTAEASMFVFRIALFGKRSSGIGRMIDAQLERPRTGPDSGPTPIRKEIHAELCQVA